MGEQRLRVLRQRSKRCCNRSNLPGANTVRVLMGHPPSTTEWTANDTNGFSRFHARLPKRHDLPSLCGLYSLFAVIHHNSYDTGMTLQIVVSGAFRVTFV